MNRSRCRLAADSCGAPRNLLLHGSRYMTLNGTFEGDMLRPVITHHQVSALLTVCLPCARCGRVHSPPRGVTCKVNPGDCKGWCAAAAVLPFVKLLWNLFLSLILYLETATKKIELSRPCVHWQSTDEQRFYLHIKMSLFPTCRTTLYKHSSIMFILSLLGLLCTTIDIDLTSNNKPHISKRCHKVHDSSIFDKFHPSYLQSHAR